jgi:hypothetical protein
MSKTHKDILPVQYASSIDDQNLAPAKEGVSREPPPATRVVMAVGMEGCDEADLEELVVEMSGEVRRLEYWPDRGAFHVSLWFNIYCGIQYFWLDV